MLVHRQKRPPYAVQMPLTPLIDIVFMLLIYFLLTTNFMVDEGIDVKLPQASASKPQVQKEITVYVDAEGSAFIDARMVSLEELFDRIQQGAAGDADRLVVIKADRAVMLEKAVQVMDTAKAAGAKRLVLATEKTP